jgi:5-methyltetrahydrofolate--homocysteine methyltransferase
MSYRLGVMTRNRDRLSRWRQRHVDERSDDYPAGSESSGLNVLSPPIGVSVVRPAGVGSELPARSPEVAVDNSVVEPPFLGDKLVSPVWLDEIVGYIDEAALFRSHWQLPPEDRQSESEWLHAMRGRLAGQLVVIGRQELLTPQVTYGFFPVNSDGNELIVWADDERTIERGRLWFPRQGQAPHLCVADYFRPVGDPDYAALQMVSIGSKITARMAQRHAGESEQDLAILRGTAAALTDALVEYWHRRIRIEWGIADEDGPSLNLVLGGLYRGYRYAVGARNHPVAIEILDAGRIGVVVGPGDEFVPEYTAASLIVHHPQATGFAVR